jgi:hypothetical protein
MNGCFPAGASLPCKTVGMVVRAANFINRLQKELARYVSSFPAMPVTKGFAYHNSPTGSVIGGARRLTDYGLASAVTDNR